MGFQIRFWEGFTALFWKALKKKKQTNKKQKNNSDKLLWLSLSFLLKTSPGWTRNQILSDKRFKDNKNLAIKRKISTYAFPLAASTAHRSLSRSHTSESVRSSCSFILQMWKPRPKAKTDLHKVSRLVRGRTSNGIPSSQPTRARSARRILRPKLSPTPTGKPQALGRKQPQLAAAAAFRPAKRPGPSRLAQNPGIGGHPRPTHLSRTASRQPHPRPGLRRPLPRRATAAAARVVRSSRPEAAGITSGGSWARGQTAPARLEHAGDTDAAG